MIYFIELLKGIIIALGIVIGMLATVGFLIGRSQVNKYKADDLLKPFEEYLERTEQEEWYEQRSEVETIIVALKASKIPKEVENFIIKKDSVIHTESHGSGSSFRLETKYTIVERRIIDTSIT